MGSDARPQRFDGGIDHSNGVVFVDMAFSSIREQKLLETINAIHESIRAGHPSAGVQIAGCSHSLGPLLPQGARS